MGEASNDSSADRIRSSATTHALGRTTSSLRDSPLPLDPPPPSDGNLHQTSAQPLKQHTDSNSSKTIGLHQVQSEKDGLPSNSSGSSQTATLQNTKEQGETNTTLGPGKKPGLGVRAKAGSKRFVQHTKDALFRSWINVLLVFVPIGIAMNWVSMPTTTHATVVFALNAVAIIPLAGLLSHATESVASNMGDTWASLLNVTFGNAVELIIFIIALAKDEITIVQASILGSILANLLLILGMAFLLGGLRFQEQIYNSTVTQMSACLLSLAVTSLLLPTAFHACFSDDNLAKSQTLKLSRGTSVILLLVYVLYLLFQLKSHAYMYESTPQRIIDEESHPGVLADMMNYSSSDSDSSSDSTDSDSSSGSYTTAKRRFRKVFKHRSRRKSNASSVQTTSFVSGLSSPSAEMRSVNEDTGTPPHENYFELSERQKNDLHSAGIATTRPGAVLSGDEADGENDRNAPRVRDFETEQPGSSKLHIARPTESKHKKHRKRKEKKKSKKVKDSEETNEATIPNVPEKTVDFAPLPPPINATTPTQSNRPFAVRQLSRVRPPLPHVFTNTVFSSPQRTPGGPVVGVLPPMNRAASGIRRANSLPNDLNRQNPGSRAQRISPNMEPAQRQGVLVVNEADAIHKDAVEDGEEEPAHMSRTAAVMLLLISTGLVAFCAELLVEAIPDMINGTNVSQAFIGLIILPIVGNAAEHVTAVTVATKNKMDLAIGVAVGSSIQIALFVTPFIVLLGWAMGKEMSLYFNLFDTVSLFVTAFVVNFLVLDGRSNYLEGSLLIAAYVIIAVGAFLYPQDGQQSGVGAADHGVGSA